ncbi:MAG: ABC transporter permease [Pirellulales bacterium]|nr:ABC transporter permease [Pirellulales bacterium]
MWLRVSGLTMRYLFLYRRSLVRAGEIFFWPVMDLVVWGFLTAYLKTMVVPQAVVYLLGALIFWDVLYRSQQAITLSVTEEIWTKNLLNIFLSPVTTFELMLSTCMIGIIKSLLTATTLGLLALMFYDFNLLDVGIALAPFMASLLLFGWAVGMCTTALVLRFGQSAEALVWGIPFLIQPFSAVFYPVDVLPGWLQIVARALPSTYVFEGMRQALDGDGLNWSQLLISFGLNAVYLAAGATFFVWMLGVVRDRGYLSRLGME